MTAAWFPTIWQWIICCFSYSAHRSSKRPSTQLLDNLHNPKSPDFHHWLTAAEIGQQYGLAPQDLSTVTGWLQSHGFSVNSVYPSGLLIDFSGTAGQIRQAFHTEIHSLNVNGVTHIANVSDPEIPEALSSAVKGVVSMHDFRPHALLSKQVKQRPEYTFTSGGYVYEAVTPGDLATIYNLTPLFANGNTGAGQTIALIEDADLYTSQDWNTFRSTFGLSQYTSGSLTTVHPSGCLFANNCADSGLLGTATTAKPRWMPNGPAQRRRMRPFKWSPAPAAEPPSAG